ncbi:MAG: RNA polymerase sigma factor SigJ [Nitrospirota bacterium]
MDDKTCVFEDNRHLLEGLAYRMLGTLADAQDVVQDTYLRWSHADTSQVRNPQSWLVTVCSRLAVDAMKSARVRREAYYGVWLPEPFVDDRAVNPAKQVEIDDTVSVALMLALESLSPEERAAFLLQEIFDYSFDEVATILGKSTAACRKLASRARARVRAAKPRFHASPNEHRRLVDAFLQAARSGDLDRLKAVLAEAVELHSDGGGRVEAVPEVLRGADHVARFFMRIWAHLTKTHSTVEVNPRWFNGAPGVLIYEGGQLATALSVAIENGTIQRIYALRNPEKLAAFEHPGLSPAQ